jgi:hypothetical protein
MPYDELLKWIKFFSNKPVGWREDYRTYLVMSSFGGSKLKPEDVFPSVKAVLKHERKSKEKKPILPTGLWLEKMIKAKDGDHNWKPFWDKKNDKTSDES